MQATRLIALAGNVLVMAAATAQVAFDGNYSQDFDALAGTGTDNPWNDDSTLAGWYASRTTYRADAGSGNTGALYSFGAASSPERALGSLASGTTGVIGYGVRLENTTGMTLDELSISYVGEQWRTSGNVTPHDLSFSYWIGDNLLSLDLQDDTGWTAVSALNFTGPVAGGSAGSLDGNLPANQIPVSHTLSGINLEPGREIFLRWADVDHTGSDHGLAIDNVHVVALATVPEPATWVLLAGGSLCFAVRSWKRRQRQTRGPTIQPPG